MPNVTCMQTVNFIVSIALEYFAKTDDSVGDGRNIDWLTRKKEKRDMVLVKDFKL